MLKKKKTLNSKQEAATKHPDKLGAGAAKMKGLSPEEKPAVVMHEFKHGALHSGSGAKVTDRKQAIAIAMSEQRKAAGRS